MDTREEIERLAREYIARYDGEAAVIAAGQADSMLDIGDIPAYELWLDVVTVIQALRAGKS